MRAFLRQHAVRTAAVIAFVSGVVGAIGGAVWYLPVLHAANGGLAFAALWVAGHAWVRFRGRQPAYGVLFAIMLGLTGMFAYAAVDIWPSVKFWEVLGAILEEV